MLGLLLLAALVAVLAVMWWAAQEHRREPEPAELPDPHDVLIERLTRAAADARAAGHHQDAQLLSLKAAWLRTRPRLGDDEPPQVLDPDDERHLRLVNALWSGYGKLLADDTAPYASCAYRPQSMLEYPRASIARALGLLVDIGEGRVRSIHVDARSVPPDAVDAIREALDQLNRFVDVPVADLPEDPGENARVGRGYAAGG